MTALRRPRFVCRAALAGLIASALLSAPAGATDQTGAEQTPGEQLEDVERGLEASRTRLEERRAKANRLADEAELLRKRSVEAAREVQTREAELTEIESRLQILLREENTVDARLRERQRQLVSVLGALQSMERNKPPALLVQPGDAVDAARSAMLLGSILPDLHGQAEIIGTELTKLTDLRTRIQDKRDAARLARTALETERATLARLIEDKTRLQKATAAAAAIDAARIARLAERARSLRGLIEGLRDRVERLAPTPRPVPPRDEDGAPAEGLGSAFARLARGQLRRPVTGDVVRNFGSRDDSGGRTEGITLRARAAAQVVAPFDSTVVFAQDYRAYGRVLILAAGDGYHFVLTGLDQIYGVVGQHLLAGEPVGSMAPPQVEAASARAPGAGFARPELYFELRKDGTPIDPLPWLAAPFQKVSG